MIRTTRKETIFIAVLSILCAAFIGYSCATGNSPRTVDLRTLAQKIDVSELTPVEAKRLETVLNREASPCGDDVTLAESLSNAANCPLSPGAGRYVVDQIKEDYSEDEISKSYLMRYGMVKGMDIPLDGSPIRGAEKPVITVVVFTDFQCPFCAKAAEVLDEMYRRHGNEYAFVVKNFPLVSVHPQSEPAARAAFAAHMQNKFWEMHDMLFMTVGTELTRERIDVMAEGLGLDMDKFAADFSSTAATASLENDRKLGESLGVHATPSIFINGRPVESGIGGVPERIQEELLRASLRKK
jgi:protein-disulfide isomerase